MAPRSKRGRTRHAVSHEDDDGAWRDDDACALRADEAREGEAAFTRYYRDAQRICRDAEDWRALLASLRTPLPVSFRVSRVAARQPEVAAALSIAEPLLRTSHPLGARGSRTAPPARRFASVHGLDAWQLGCDARALRQAAKHAPESALAALGRWIIEHNASGVLTRQELVSMVRRAAARNAARRSAQCSALHAARHRAPRAARRDRYRWRCLRCNRGRPCSTCAPLPDPSQPKRSRRFCRRRRRPRASAAAPAARTRACSRPTARRSRGRSWRSRAVGCSSPTSSTASEATRSRIVAQRSARRARRSS